jgi:hypothetical protein
VNWQMDTTRKLAGIARLRETANDKRGHARMGIRGLLILAIWAGALAMFCEEAAARTRPETKFCLRGPTGGVACRYNTLEQCRMAASGTGGSCMHNPRYRGRR